MPTKKKKRKPPSRVRYESNHPVASVRISRELHDELRRLKKLNGSSMADILRIGLEKARPLADRAFKQGYQDALEDCLGAVEACPRCYQAVVEYIPDY